MLFENRTLWFVVKAIQINFAVAVFLVNRWKQDLTVTVHTELNAVFLFDVYDYGKKSLLVDEAFCHRTRMLLGCLRALAHWQSG